MERQTRGFTLVELAIASAVLAVVLTIGFGIVVREHRMTRSAVAIGVAEVHAQDMLNRLTRVIGDAEGELPRALVATNLGAGATGSLDVDTTLGFPDQGILLLERGTGSMERIAYDALGAGGASFRGLARGVQCTSAHGHTQGASVLWGSLAQVVPLSGSPPPSDYDGRALEPEGQSFFVGDGTGFSYRLPTDPNGGTDVLQGDGIRWGAVAGGAPTLTGWAALVFVPVSIVSEDEIHVDLDHDGDETDTFEVGQIRARAWDTANPATPASDIGLGPPVILQELCGHGHDLDGDGYDDPIFLWNPIEGRLHVRLFVLGRSKGEVPAVRKVETTLFLRNVAKT
jgi:prepilin-type N-terminal cleavage/methylation domain-containing protein